MFLFTSSNGLLVAFAEEDKNPATTANSDASAKDSTSTSADKQQTEVSSPAKDSVTTDKEQAEGSSPAKDSAPADKEQSKDSQKDSTQTGDGESTSKPDTTQKPDMPEITDNNVNANLGTAVDFHFKDGEATVTLNNYSTNASGDGYLMIDVKEEFVKGYSSKYFDKDDKAMTVTTDFSNGNETIIENKYSSYKGKKNDTIRFYIPYNAKNKGPMKVTFTIPKKVQDKLNKELEEANKKDKENEYEKEPHYCRIAGCHTSCFYARRLWQEEKRNKLR